MPPGRRGPRLADALVIGGILAFGLVAMRPFELRMATLHEDDGPILYARAWVAPDLFAGDYIAGLPIESILPAKVASSLMVGVPAALWRWLDVDPYGSTWVVALVQGAGIGVAAYVFGLVLTRRRSVAALGALLTYVVTPWVWNLANYGNDASWTFVPYAATLALVFGLPALAAALAGRAPLAIALALAAGWVHPLAGLQAAAILGVFWLTEGRPGRAVLLRLGVLAAVAVAMAAPSLMAEWHVRADMLPAAEALPGLKQNAHIWPWGNPAWWRSSIVPTSLWLCVALASLGARTDWRTGAARLWLASAVVALGMSAAHAVGALTESPTLLGLVGLRAWMWPSILAVPLVAAMARRAICAGHGVLALAGVGLVALPFIDAPRAASWAMIGAAMLAGVAIRVGPPAGAAAQAPAPGWRSWVWAGTLAAAFATFGWREVQAAATFVSPASSDWQTVDVQRWARTETPPSSRFVVTRPGWRTLSERRRLDPFTREGYAYVAPRAARDWRDRLLDFYGVPEAERESQRGTALVQRQIAAYRTFAERDFLRFGSELGATHLVIPTCYPETDRVQFDLPVAYSNACYIVYDIDTARMEARERIRREADARVRREAIVWLGDALSVTAQTRLTVPGRGLDLKAGSLSIWGRLATPPSPYADLVRVNGSSDLYIYRSTDGLEAHYAGVRLGSIAIPHDDGWHHYTITWRDGEQRVYVDGRLRLKASARASAAPVTSVALGWLGTRDGEQWVGDLGPVAAFARPLDDDEVAALFRYTDPLSSVQNDRKEPL